MAKSLTMLLADKGLRHSDLARKCAVNKSTVTRWVERGVPLVRVFQIERETGIPKEKIRPDFFVDEARA